MHKPFMKSRRGAGFLGLCGALFGCGFPSFDFHHGDAGGDATPSDVATDALSDAEPSCPATGSVDHCTEIPLFTGAQQIDGRGDEFCSLPGQTLDSSATRIFFYRSAKPADVTEVATLRTGWSNEGLHMHVHVADANLFVPPNGSQQLHEGDAIEIYVAGYVPTSGAFDATTDIGAQHIIVSPPSGAIGARGFVWTSSCDFPVPAALNNAFFTGRTVRDGWEIELDLPWSILLPSPTDAPPTSGAKIGFTFALDAQDVESGDPLNARQMQAFLGYQTITVASPSCDSCSRATPEPFCDDRTWCTPTLQ
jgi:hypothetical protein